ncbi:1316_t:CDS:1, partial [Racocetra persica]
SGEVCNQPCYHPNGCKVYQDSPIRYPCKENGCNKLTFSDYGYCDDYVQKYYRRQYRHQKKLEKMVQDGSE